MASRRCSTLYVGSTSDIVRRVWERRHAEVESFTKRYGMRLLVYLECRGRIVEVRRREAQIKRWQRLWKVQLIESIDPQWHGLSADIHRWPKNEIPDIRT